MIKFLDILKEREDSWNIEEKFPIKVHIFQTRGGNYRIEPSSMTMSYKTFEKLGDNLSEEQIDYGKNRGIEYSVKDRMYPNDVRINYYDYKTGECAFLASTMKDVENWLKKHRNLVTTSDDELTNRTTINNSEMVENEITERCWKGYTQKGMKTMFGKRYPNCVKKKK